MLGWTASFGLSVRARKVHQPTASPKWGDAIPKPNLLNLGTIGDGLVGNIISCTSFGFDQFKGFDEGSKVVMIKQCIP
jgi:hypothetical protein